MSGFIVTPADPVTPEGEAIICGPFWPDIDVNAFRDAMRVGGNTVPDPRIKEALRGGVITALNDLTAWQATQEALGYLTLSEVPAIAIDGETRLTLSWRRAVFAYAAAELAETHQDITAAATGATQGEAIAPTADHLKRDGLRAVRDILGQPRITTELI